MIKHCLITGVTVIKNPMTKRLRVGVNDQFQQLTFRSPRPDLGHDMHNIQRLIQGSGLLGGIGRLQNAGVGFRIGAGLKVMHQRSRIADDNRQEYPGDFGIIRNDE